MDVETDDCEAGLALFYNEARATGLYLEPGGIALRHPSDRAKAHVSFIKQMHREIFWTFAPPHSHMEAGRQLSAMFVTRRACQMPYKRPVKPLT